MSKYLWIEDRIGKASFIFWSNLLEELFPEVIVQSKTNNSELVKAVRDVEVNDDRYIIVFDNSFDNFELYHERKALKEYVDLKDNVILLDIICFEYILLEFDKLIDWIYAPVDEFRVKRLQAIEARNKLVEVIKSGDFDYKAVREIIDYDNNLYNHNIEQLSAKLLHDLTRNTGFEVTKGYIGECWINDCCDWINRQADDICGLDSDKLSKYKKMYSIYMGTSLKKNFELAGLEA